MAETEILRAGSWQERRLQAEGAVVVEVLIDVPGAALAVDGLQGSLRHHSPTSGAFPLKAAAEGVFVIAAAADGAAFPGGALADLSLTFPSTGQSYLLQGMDVSGHARAPLVELTWDQDRWKLLPATEPTRSVGGPRAGEHHTPSARGTADETRGASDPRSEAARSEVRRGGAVAAPMPSADAPRAEILGSWLARRLRERGQLRSPGVSTLLVDDSASMRSHRERASALTTLLRSFLSAAGAPDPEIRNLAVGRAEHAGVGSAAIPAPSDPASADAGHRVSIVITDLPGRSGALPTLVVGDPDLARALLDTGSTLVLGPEAWREIEREDTDYDDATLRQFLPLAQWLEDPRHTEENA